MPERLKRKRRPRLSKRRFDALIADATVDCSNESEAVTGLFTMIEDHLEVPFATVVLGIDVEVTGVELTEREEIVAVCVRGKQRQRIPICDLPLPAPPPAGAEWIEAYRRWAVCG
ncbi:MAG: hypothetical protein HY763_10285 [Planctomycetes bacterium]|nr:hypothetical protein [Planctomycetota bacterium]